MSPTVGDEVVIRREGVASQVADTLRGWIIDGRLAPGSRISEEHMRDRLGVSRNTLREAFQLLVRDRLLVHHLSRGIFVRELTLSDVSDIYYARRLLEVSAISAPGAPEDRVVRMLQSAVEMGFTGVKTFDRDMVTTANLRFHQGIVALHRSERLDEYFAKLMAEFRLFHVALDVAPMENAYVQPNADLAEHIIAGRRERATSLLGEYFDRAETELMRRLQEER